MSFYGRFISPFYYVGAKSTSSEVAREESFLAGEEHSTIQSSTRVQNIRGDSIPSLGVSGETQIDEAREKGRHSDKTDFSSTVGFK